MQCMPITHLFVREMTPDERSALERLLGHSLNDAQRLAVQVLNECAQDNSQQAQQPAMELPAWFNVYEGLSEAEIADIESSIFRDRSHRTVD